MDADERASDWVGAPCQRALRTVGSVAIAKEILTQIPLVREVAVVAHVVGAVSATHNQEANDEQRAHNELS